MYPCKDVLKVLISVRKGKSFAKGAKAQIAFFPMSKCCPDPDISIRNVIALAKQKAKLCLILPGTLAVQNMILTQNVTMNAALLTSATLCMLSSQQSEHAYTSAFHEADPKNQCKTRASPNVEKWKQAEEIEIKTLWGMGTWQIVDQPQNCTPLPGVWSYRVKRNRDGNISKYKAQWCAHGDMQMPW
eukprot:1590347-Rhodomonas_salina.1